MSTRRIGSVLALLAVGLTFVGGSVRSAGAAPVAQFATPTATPTIAGLPLPSGGGFGVSAGPRGPLIPATPTPTPVVVLVPGAAAEPNAYGTAPPPVSLNQVTAPPGAPNPSAPLVGSLETGPPPQALATALIAAAGAAVPTLTATPTATPTLATQAAPLAPGVGPAHVLPSPVPTATWTPTPTLTPTATSTPTATATPTVTATPTPSIRAPANLRVVSSGPAPGTYTIAWDAGNTETVMEYHVLAVGAGGDLRPLFTVAGSASQAVLTGLDPAIGYTLAIKAVDVLGRESGPSNSAQTAVAPTATPITPPFGGGQGYGGAGLAPPGAPSPYGPTGQGAPAPYGAPPSPYGPATQSGAPAPFSAPAPTSPYGPVGPAAPAPYQPGVSAPPAYLPTPTVSVYQAPYPASAPFTSPYPPR